jgi:hypothetical protein
LRVGHSGIAVALEQRDPPLAPIADRSVVYGFGKLELGLAKCLRECPILGPIPSQEIEIAKPISAVTLEE